MKYFRKSTSSHLDNSSVSENSLRRNTVLFRKIFTKVQESSGLLISNTVGPPYFLVRKAGEADEAGERREKNFVLRA
jgi:hypothetical protein